MNVQRHVEEESVAKAEPKQNLNRMEEFVLGKQGRKKIVMRRTVPVNVILFLLNNASLYFKKELLY